MMRFAGLLLAAVTAMFAFTSVVSAQYPLPGGSGSCVGSPSTVPIGGTVIYTCTFLNLSGGPLSGLAVTATITGDVPPFDSAVGSKQVTKSTNAAGVVTFSLFVGSGPGQITLTFTGAGTTISTTAIATVFVLNSQVPVYYPFVSPYVAPPVNVPIVTAPTPVPPSVTTTQPVAVSPPVVVQLPMVIQPPNTGDAGLLMLLAP